MCGIFGNISISKNLKNNKNFLKSLSLLSHKDHDEGYFLNDQIAFGHKRLSIIDLTKNGKQPMFFTGKKQRNNL